jgi:hypothetical protein
MPENWSPTCNRFVAFLDIMGFKDLVSRQPHSVVYDKLNLFYSFIKPIEDLARNETNSDLASQQRKVRMVIFSDSIMLVSRDETEESANQILSDISYVTMCAIEAKIPLTGAIAYGKQTADFPISLHFGQPLIDAYELQKQLQLYGTVLHHTTEQYLAELDILKKLENERIFMYAVPMKTGKIRHYIVDWGQLYPKLATEFSQLYLSVSGKPRQYVDNTLEFVKWVIAKKAELAEKQPI